MGLEQANFKIVINGEDKTSLFKPRLISLKVSESQGDRADTIDIEVDNRGRKIPLPKTGAVIEISIGYGDKLVSKGEFEVDELEEPIAIDTIRIHAKASKIKESFKAPKNATYDDITLRDLTQKIADTHGFEAVVSSDLSVVEYDHIDQVSESDMNLLSRLAVEQGAVLRPIANRLLILPKGEAKKASGSKIETIKISDSKDSKGRLVISERSKYKKVIAHWFDEMTQERKEVSEGSGEPVFTIRNRAKNEARAQALAKAKLQALQREVKKLSLTRQLMPRVVAEGKIEISGHKNSINDTWVVSEVTHSISVNSAATTSMSLSLPNQ